MVQGLAITLADGPDGSVAAAIVEDDASVRIGPTLCVRSVGSEGRMHAHRLFEGLRGHSGAQPVDPVLELLARAEQLALDKLYAGPASANEAARVRVVVTWAVLVIQELLRRGPVDGEVSAARRLDRLIALCGSEGVDSLQLVSPAPATGDGRRLSGEAAGFATQVRAAVRARDRRRRGDADGPTADAASAETRDIALHPFRNRWAIFSEIGAGIAFTTFASAGSFVFLGTRLQKCAGPCKAGGLQGFTASLDIIALVICSFGFLFATLSYANATGVLARLSTLGYENALERGNRVSEYFGVYPLIFAIPLAVEQSTSAPIPFIVKLVGLTAFLGYHAAHQFALLERVIGGNAIGSDRQRRWVVTVLLALLFLTWFGPSVAAGDLGLWIRVSASAALLSATVAIYALASVVPEQAHPMRYRVHRDDPLSDESPSLYDLRPPP